MNKITYGDMSWQELKEVVGKKKVATIPVGSTEQHGPHLPTKTDAFLATRICEQAAKEKPELSFVMPPVSYGCNEHHLDFPATIHINHETMIRFVIDIGKSLVDMSKAVRDWGFEKSKFVNYGVEPGGKTFGNAGGKVQFMDWWSRMSTTGTMGDPTKFTKEKGKKIFDLCTNALIEFIEQFQKREIRERIDHHR